MVRDIEQQLRDYFHFDGCLKSVKQLAVALSTDGESIVVSAVYQDGRTSRTIFEGNADVNDVEDIIAVAIEELTNNSDEVAGQLAGNTPLLVSPVPFPEVTHRRGPAPKLPWGGQWMPPPPIPSIR